MDQDPFDRLMADYPVVLALCFLFYLLGIACVLAFLIQWNRGTVLLYALERYRHERGEMGWVVACLRFLTIGSIIAFAKIWDESRGARWLFPIGLAMIAIGSLLYRAIQIAVE